MASRSERFEIYTSFVREGDPNQIISDLKKVEDQAKKAGDAVKGGGTASAGAANQHQAAAAEAKGLGGALGQASAAAQTFGGGLSRMNVPGMQFVGTAGNMLGGAKMLTSGLGGLISQMSPLAVGLGIGAVALTGLGLALHAAAKSAEEYIAKIRDVAAITGLSLEQTGRDVAAANNMFGAEGAMGVYGAITSSQAGVAANPTALFQQLAAARMGPGYKPWMQDPLARWGLSEFKPGSTPRNPMTKDPMSFLFEAARAGNQLDPNMKALFLNQVGSSVGGKDQLSYVMRQLAAGKSEAELRGSGLGGFKVTEEDVKRLDEFTTAQNELNQAMRELGSELGQSVLPMLTGFLKGLTEFIKNVRDGAHAVGEWLKGLGITPQVMQNIANTIGKVLVPALLLLAGVIIIGFAPVIGIILLVLGLLAALMGVLPGLGGLTKGLSDNFSALAGSFKLIDWPSQSTWIKTWGDVTTGVFDKVSAAKDALIQNVRALAAELAKLPLVAQVVVLGMAALGLLATVFYALPKLVTVVVSLVVQGLEALAGVLAGVLGLPAVVLITIAIAVAAYELIPQVKQAVDSLVDKVVHIQLQVDPAYPDAAVAQTAQAVQQSWAADTARGLPMPAVMPQVGQPSAVGTQTAQEATQAFDSTIASDPMIFPCPFTPEVVDPITQLAQKAKDAWDFFWNGHQWVFPPAKFQKPGGGDDDDHGSGTAATAKGVGTAASLSFAEALKEMPLRVGITLIDVAAMAMNIRAWAGNVIGEIAGALAQAVSGVNWLQVFAAMAAGLAAGMQAATPIFAFAEGGLVTKPTLAVIGEAGPELIVPLNDYGGFEGGAGLPPITGSGVGGNVEVNVYVQGLDFSDARSVERVARAVGDHVVRNVRTMSAYGGIR